MHIVKNPFPNDQANSLNKTLTAQTAGFLAHNLALKHNEQLLVITIPEMLTVEAAIWLAAASQFTTNVQLICLQGMHHSGEEPPAEVIAAATQAGVTIMQTMFSLTHTQAGKQALVGGGRALSLPGADLALITLALQTDYEVLRTLGLAVEQKLKAGKQIRITSDQGTDLTATIRQSGVEAETGFLRPGEIGNLPSGEVFFAPVLKTANGTLVIDGAIADDVLDAPITIEIRDGRATKFSGGLAAQNLGNKLKQFGKKGLIVAEIGIGTNKDAKISDNLLETEKAFGTVHVAFGNSSAIGGENNVAIHIDGLVSQPTVWVDGGMILQNKRFTT